MMNCPTCQTTMEVSELHCTHCNLKLQGSFQVSRLARLSRDHMKLAEAFLLSGGNLKQLAEQMQLSYPTLRRKVDDMIAALKKTGEEDAKRAEEILAKIEQGKMNPQEGLRLIREMNGET